jgi:hypothetical protein
LVIGRLELRLGTEMQFSLSVVYFNLLALVTHLHLALLTCGEEQLSAPFESMCKLYLYKSTIDGAGRGVFVGDNFAEEEILESAVTIAIPRTMATNSQLHNYVFDTGIGGYSMISLGVSSLLNHASFPNVHHTWADHDLKEPQRIAHLPFSVFTMTVFKTSETVIAGQELFISYGDDWLVERGLDDSLDVAASVVPLEELSSAVCMSTITLGESQINGAGVGAFATRAFRAGELITVSPVLLLNASRLLHNSSHTPLLNYCIGKPGSRAALLPLGHAALINHAPALAANVRMAWFTAWQPAPSSEPETRGEEKEESLSALLQKPFAPFDLAYYATRDIAEGDELLLFYGLAWEQAWTRWTEEEEKEDDEAGAPFRHMVMAPEGLLPASWIEEERCVSSDEGAREL